MKKADFYSRGHQHRHLILLLGLIVFLTLPDLVEKMFAYRISFPIMLVLLVASGSFVIQTRLQARLIKNLFVGVFLIFLLVWSRFQEMEWVGALAYIALFLYFLILTIYLFKDLIHAGSVTVSTILGAFCGYILLGVMWFFIYGFFDAAYPDTFNVDFDAESGVANMLYFSFITLTTIGYGDFVPTSGLGQKLVILEGLIGHFYLAIVMAILVGMYLRGSAKETQRD